MSDDKGLQAVQPQCNQSELIEPLGAGGDRAEYFRLGCDMLIAAHSDLEKHIEKLETELKAQQELERQYCQRLGRMAQLCDTVIPDLMDCLHESQVADLPEEVTSGIGEIMDYVDMVRP